VVAPCRVSPAAYPGGYTTLTDWLRLQQAAIAATLAAAPGEERRGKERK
jgi:hypothetical protein